MAVPRRVCLVSICSDGDQPVVSACSGCVTQLNHGHTRDLEAGDGKD